MKKLLLLISLVLIISCHNKEEEKLTKNSSLNRIEETTSCNDMLGIWYYKENDESHSYTLKIESAKNDYLVESCFITGENGEKIDCPEEKEIGKCNGKIMTVELTSDFEDNPIKCNLKLVNNVLKLHAISNVGTSFFLEEMDFVRKK